MVKFKKDYNILTAVFVATLIGVFLFLNNPAYSVPNYSHLRVPLRYSPSSKEIIEIQQRNINSSYGTFFRKKVEEFIIQDVSRDRLTIPIIMMLGKPGSGKGTLAKIFAEKFKIKCISTGDLLRQHFGDNISGLRKPDDAIDFLEEWFKKEKPYSGFVLDMTPESQEDYNRFSRFLNRNNCSVAAVIDVEVSDEISRQRLRKRKNRLEEVTMGESGTQRRLNNFRDNIVPFIETAEETGLLFKIANEGDKYDKEIVKIGIDKNIHLESFFKNRRINEKIRTLQIFYTLKDKTKGMGITDNELISVYSPLICHIEELLEREQDKLIIGISGPTRVGKSVLTERLSMLMNSLNVSERYSAVLHADGFYLTDDELDDRGLREERSSPYALKAEELIREMNNFKQGQDFEQQNVSRIPNQRRIRLESKHKTADKVLIVDGGFILNNDTIQYQSLYKMFDLSIAMQADLESLRRWRAEEKIELGLENHDAEWNRIVGYVKNERKIWTRADLIIKKSKDRRAVNLEYNPIKITSNLERIIIDPIYNKYLEEIKNILGQGEDFEVAFIVPTFKGGGVAEATKELAKYLFGSGININGSCYEMVRDGIPYFEAVSRAIFDVLEDKRELTEDEKRIYEKAIEISFKNMNLEGCTHVFLNDPFTLGLIPIIRQKYPQIKIIWMLHGLLLRYKQEVSPIALNDYLKDADLAVFILPEFIPPGLAKPSAILKPGLNPWSYKNIFLDKNFINATLKKYNIDQNKKMILQVGRYDGIKDPLAAIQSFCKFREMLSVAERDDYQLVFIGLDTLFYDMHRKQVLIDFVSKSFNTNNIHIIGFVPEKTDFNDDEENYMRELGIEPDILSGFDKNALEINAFQRAASLILLPSYKESFPNVILEAIWKKKPILATKIGGLSEQLKKEYLIPIDTFHIETTKALYRELYSNSPDYRNIEVLLNKRKLPDEFARKMYELLKRNYSDDNSPILDEHHKKIMQKYLILNSLSECIEILKSCL